MTESTTPEGTQLTLVQALGLRRSLTEAVLDKATSDPLWKQQLLDDPESAMRQAADLPEFQHLQQANERVLASLQQDEVRGHIGDTWGPIYRCGPFCEWYTSYWMVDCWYDKA